MFHTPPARQEIITLSKPLSYLAPLVLPEKRISFGDVIYMISSSEFLTMTKIVIIILNCIFFSSLTDIGIGYAKNLCA